MIGISGNPGSGKSTLAVELRARGFSIISLTDLIVQTGLIENEDGQEVIDLDRLNKWFDQENLPSETIIEGHFAHQLEQVHRVFFLQLTPEQSHDRLAGRGYPAWKLIQNEAVCALEISETQLIERKLDHLIVPPKGQTCETIADLFEEWLNGHPPYVVYEGTSLVDRDVWLLKSPACLVFPIEIFQTGSELRLTIRRAERSFRSSRNRTRILALETLLLATGTDQLERAFKLGNFEAQTRIWMAIPGGILPDPTIFKRSEEVMEHVSLCSDNFLIRLTQTQIEADRKR